MGTPTAASTGIGLDRRWRRIWFGLSAALFVTGLFAGGSWDLIPPDHSRCKRLQALDFDDALLSLLTARLVLPQGHTWRQIDIAYHLEPGEALNLALDRADDDFDVVRVSLAPELPSARLALRGGELVESAPLGLPADSAAAGRLSLSRSERGIEVRAGDALFTTVARTAPLTATFDLALFPPWSPALFQRVRLEQVILDDGQELAPHPDHLEELAHSPQLLALVGIAIAAVLMRGRPSLLERLLANHAARHPGHVAVLLAGMTVGVAVVALGVAHSGELVPIGEARQMRFRVMLATLIAAALLLAFARDWLLGRFPRLAERAGMGAAWLLPQVAVTMLFAIGVARLPGARGPGLAGTAHEAPRNATLRLITYGASRDSGAPFFVDDLPSDLPRELEGLLQRATGGNVAAWDGGPAIVSELAPRLARDIALLHPTHVLLPVRADDPGIAIGSYRAALDELHADIDGPRLVLVEALAFDAVYGGTRSAPSNVIREAAAAHHATFVPVAAAFERESASFLFLDRGQHLTRYGHRLMARAIADAITAGPPKGP